MRTSLEQSTDGRLLVDIEGGRVLRSDDYVVTSERYLDTHPFIERTGGVVLAGGQGVSIEDQVQYDVVRETAGFVHLQKVDAI